MHGDKVHAGELVKLSEIMTERNKNIGNVQEKLMQVCHQKYSQIEIGAVCWMVLLTFDFIQNVSVFNSTGNTRIRTRDIKADRRKRRTHTTGLIILFFSLSTHQVASVSIAIVKNI